MRCLLSCALAAFFASAALAQPKPADLKPGDAMIQAYLNAETDKLSQKFLDGAKTLEEWTAKRPRLHREYMDMLGLWPLPEKNPLKATITRTFENQGVVIDNLHYQSRPGLYVTANLYRPKGNTKKLPTILYVCGHTNKGRDGNKTAFQDHGLWFASNGYNCLVLDTLQLGEIPGIHHGTYNKERWWWHSAGYTPAGVECWNGVRGIDYLLTRDDVDPAKIGVTGISGGGAATIWIAAADERVKVAVPVSGMADLESYVKNKVVNGHCDCMFLYNTYQWEWTTILALLAPRPMLFANSDKDSIFPMDANRRIAARMQTIYGFYGKANLTTHYVSSGGHAYRPDLRVAVFKFMNKHLKGDATSPVEDSAAFKEIPGKELRVFPMDEDLPRDRINGRIDETFVGRGKVELPNSENFTKWRDSLIAEVRQRSFRPFPQSIGGSRIKGPAIDAETEPGIRCVASLPGGDLKSLNRTLQVSPHREPPDRESFGRYWNGLREMKSDSILLGVATRQGMSSAWTRKSPPNMVERSHMLLGRTADQGDVRDVLSMIETYKLELKDDPKVAHHWTVSGYGEAGIIAVYAALLNASINEVIVAAPPTSHKHGPHFPGILRVLDIPDAFGLLAPRPLTIIGDDPAFDRTAEIYRLAGAADKLKRLKK
jgi:dienelactone hydrolase